MVNKEIIIKGPQKSKFNDAVAKKVADVVSIMLNEKNKPKR
jgi:flagellar basal body L-ring protein FlgH